MKMSPQAFAALENLVLDNHRPENSWLKYQAAGLSYRRYCFDLLWSIPQSARDHWFNSFGIYKPEGEDLTDDHIFAALKQIDRRISR